MGQADGTLRDRHWNRRSSRAGNVSGGRVPRGVGRRQRERGVGRMDDSEGIAREAPGAG
jgi:hypothetical protein